jgi:hypothetical protein
VKDRNKTAKIGLPGQDYTDRSAGAGLPGQDCLDSCKHKAVSTGLLG